MQSLDPKSYTVRKGDDLSSIARQSGFSNWRDIYNSPANSRFRASHPNPDRLSPGEQIMIPPTPEVVRQVLQERLSSLMQLRSDTDSLYRRIEQDLDDNIRRYGSVASRTDAAATVANVLVGLGTLVYKGMAAMKLTGSALAAANHELAKDSIKLAFDPLRDPLLKFGADKIGANAGIGWTVGKVAIESFLNMQSPSWWAGVVGNLQDGKTWSEAVTSNPQEALGAVRNSVEKQRQDTLGKIDQKIRDTRTLLYGVIDGGLMSLYEKSMPVYV